LTAQSVAYQFGRFRLLPGERTLLADGAPAKLGGRAFDLLTALVERRERVVSRNELFELVWPGRVVEDQNLKVQVLALRKLIGEGAIATIPGRGYRFVAALDGDDTAVRAKLAPPPEVARTALQSNLPASLPALFGRVADIAELCRELSQHRLVSIVGPGGIGKTCVALAAASQLRSRFGDGVWIIELASLADAGDLPSTVGRTVGAVSAQERASNNSVTRALRTQSLLIVLDNCEHMLPAVCAFADALLRAAPKAVLLATSQEPLKLADERVYRLAPLDVPPAGANAGAALEHGAVALLAARVQAVDPRFRISASNVAAAIDICRALDGIALAIELAAARVPVLGIAGVRERLGERFRLLTSGTRNAPVRQQTLRAALEWSHGLLAPPEQAVFRRLGVFAGSFSLDAAQRVARDDSIDAWDLLEHLGALVDKSLVEVVGADPPRYRLLESARACAVEQLTAAGETAATADAHALAVLDAFRRADDDYLTTPALPWLDRLLPELDNLRAALSTAQRRDALLAAELAALAGFFLTLAGLGAEAARACEQTRASIDDAAPDALRARYALTVAHLSTAWMAAPDSGLIAVREAAAQYRKLCDRPRLYYALRMEVTLLERLGELSGIPSVLDEMRALEQPGWSALLLRLRRWTEAHYLKEAGNVRAYRDIFRDEVQQCLRDGDERSSWLAAHHVAVAEIALDNACGAVAVMQNAVAQIHARGLQRQFGVQVAMLANALIDAGDLRRATPVMREAVSLLVANGMLWWLADALASVPALAGDLREAARLHGWANAKSAERSGGKRGQASQRLCDRVRAELLAALSPDELHRLCDEGAGFDDDQVIARVEGTLKQR